MKRRSLLILVGLAIAGAVLASTPASAQPIDKGHFHDVFTSDVYDCDGIPAQDSGDVSGNFLFNQRGSSPFPYYRESVHGTAMTTNLETGGTFTNVFSVNTGTGGAKAFVAMAGVLMAAALAAPVLVVAGLLHGLLAPLVIPLGIGYGLAALLVGTYIGGDALERRGPELLVSVTPRR